MLRGFALLAFSFCCHWLWAADGPPDLVSFVQSHCISCHGGDTPEGEVRLLPLAPIQHETAELWSRIARQIDVGDMPPPGEPRPSYAHASAVVSEIARALSQVTPAASATRRLNRNEYEATVHDLLSIDASLAPLLPEDAQVQGFDNVAGGLGISSILMERYLEAADTAFESTIRRIQPLPPSTRHAVLMDVKENQESVEHKKGGVIEAAGAFVDFSPGWPPARIDPAHPIEDGLYRCRVAVWPVNPGNRTLALAVFSGPLFGPGKLNFNGMFDVTGSAEEPRIIEFKTKLGEGHSLHLLPWIFPQHVTWRDKEEPQPGVAIQWTETYGPLDQDYPSRAQQQLFGTASTIQMAEGYPVWMRHRKGVKSSFVDSTDPRADLERIIRDFAPRAFRRPVEDAIVAPFVRLALQRLDEGNTFEQAVRVGVTAILCSPHFLLLNQEETVDSYTIASRLSYFLWSSMPDDTLLALATEGKLLDPVVRHAQVDRMLADPRSERFVEHFTGQWLDLRKLEATTPDAKLYPEYDELLLRSMQAETQTFFRHLLDENLSVTNFVDADFTFLNERLARHYGIPGITGHEVFRRVTLPVDSIRGGILTHASVLKVTANGTSTSPVVRGAWVLENLLGQAAPAPPAGVPAVEPDIRGATTIRDQLARHRQSVSCNRCHARIDPPGFALEVFDVIGGQRSAYRSLEGKGGRVTKTNYYVGLPVEEGGKLHDGREFANFDQFRQCLLAQPDLIARAVAEKLLVYGSGRPVTLRDRPSIDQMLQRTRADNYGLRSLIHTVVDSELFLH